MDICPSKDFLNYNLNVFITHAPGKGTVFSSCTYPPLICICVQVKLEYSSGNVPDYINNVMSNERTLQPNRFVFTKQKKTYDASRPDRDIAILQVL
jgi:hypothetical protein